MSRPKDDFFPSTQSTVPAFLLKLRDLLDDTENEHLVSWDESGESFHLYDQVSFSKQVLPKYFKHSNLASFIRQLNMYGFKKISTVDHGSLHSKEDMEFQNPFFVRDNPQLMESIKRKGSIKDKIAEYHVLKPEQMTNVLAEVKNLQTSQNGFTRELEVIKRENSVLWREIASLRQKHAQQQHIINKLIQFLMTMAGSRRNLKRHLPMIEIGPSKKVATDPVLCKILDDNQLQPIQTADSGNGIRIQDITDNDTASEQPLSVNIVSPFSENTDFTPKTTVETVSPSQSTVSTPASVATSTAADTNTNIVAVPSSPDPNDFKLNFSDNIDGLQSDIDILRDLFSSETLGIPQDTVYSLFDSSTDQAPSSTSKADNEDLLDLNDLIQNATSERKQQFINDVSDQLPKELNSLINEVPTASSAPLTDPTSWENLFNQSQQAGDHQPIISSHELD